MNLIEMTVRGTCYSQYWLLPIHRCLAGLQICI